MRCLQQPAILGAASQKAEREQSSESKQTVRLTSFASSQVVRTRRVRWMCCCANKQCDAQPCWTTNQPHCLRSLDRRYNRKTAYSARRTSDCHNLYASSAFGVSPDVERRRNVWLRGYTNMTHVGCGSPRQRADDTSLGVQTYDAMSAYLTETVPRRPFAVLSCSSSTAPYGRGEPRTARV